MSGLSVVDGDSGMSLVLAKVSVDDALLARPAIAGSAARTAPPPPLTPFHRRLAWVAVIDPPVMSSCPADAAPSAPTAPSLPASPAVPDSLVPYQALVLDATTGADGLVYQARTNQPCEPAVASGPGVGPLIVTVSVPWRLMSRDPGGLFGTISVATTSCDEYQIGANTSRTQSGLVEFDVWRPIAPCGAAKDVTQTLRGPTVSDPLPARLTHAAKGFVDMPPAQGAPRAVSSAGLLCEQAFGQLGPVAATYATTVAALRSVHGGPFPGGYPFAAALAPQPATAAAAWCEYKAAKGYVISAVGPDGAALDGVRLTVVAFVDLSNGPPALP